MKGLLLPRAGPIGVVFVSVALLAGPSSAAAHLRGDQPPAHDHDVQEVTDDQLERFAKALDEIAEALDGEGTSPKTSAVRTLDERHMGRILKRHGLTPEAFDRIRRATEHDRELAKRLKVLRERLTDGS